MVSGSLYFHFISSIRGNIAAAAARLSDVLIMLLTLQSEYVSAELAVCMLHLALAHAFPADKIHL